MSEAYPYIRVWGKMMGSFDYFIDSQQQRAEAVNAPPNAIVVNDDDTVSTTDDILAATTRQRFVGFCESLGVPSPWSAFVF